jgi:hypothetical protein
MRRKKREENQMGDGWMGEGNDSAEISMRLASILHD